MVPVRRDGNGKALGNESHFRQIPTEMLWAKKFYAKYLNQSNVDLRFKSYVFTLQEAGIFFFCSRLE